MNLPSAHKSLQYLSMVPAHAPDTLMGRRRMLRVTQLSMLLVEVAGPMLLCHNPKP